MSEQKVSRADEQEKAREQLRQMFPPGTTVSTVLRHVTSSGMSRSISVIHADTAGPDDVSWLVARAMGEKIDPKHGGIKRGGCGMDMGFDLVYSLSRTLYPEGFTCIGEVDRAMSRGRSCPSNDHSNGDRNYNPHQHRDGGYALRHRWL